MKTRGEKNKQRLHRRISRRGDKKCRGWGNDRCHICGGQMSWCSICEMYSSNCCQDYGTCQCS